MPSPATCRLASLEEQIAAQLAVIARFEAALWDGGFNEPLLPSYQSAWRRLEALIAARGDDRRHSFVLVIPVADSPQQLRACLDSLHELCTLYGYGGRHDGRYRKVSVTIADDTCDPGLIAAHQAIARDFDARGIRTLYFGLDEQRTLMASLPESTALPHIVGNAGMQVPGHKGQAIMRNIAYLKLAQMQTSDAPLLFYTLDADQTFKVKIATADGDCEVHAVNFLAQLDRIFSATDAEVLTGKVVGDPPVSPAVMAGNFLEDVIGFLQEMAGCDPRAKLRITTWPVCSVSSRPTPPIAIAARSTAAPATPTASMTFHAASSVSSTANIPPASPGTGTPTSCRASSPRAPFTPATTPSALRP
jgi:hypothetical protein